VWLDPVQLQQFGIQEPTQVTIESPHGLEYYRSRLNQFCTSDRQTDKPYRSCNTTNLLLLLLLLLLLSNKNNNNQTIKQTDRASSDQAFAVGLITEHRRQVGLPDRPT
jgi:hypothetical protein